MTASSHSVEFTCFTGWSTERSPSWVTSPVAFHHCATDCNALSPKLLYHPSFDQKKGKHLGCLSKPKCFAGQNSNLFFAQLLENCSTERRSPARRPDIVFVPNHYRLLLLLLHVVSKFSCALSRWVIFVVCYCLKKNYFRQGLQVSPHPHTMDVARIGGQIALVEPWSGSIKTAESQQFWLWTNQSIGVEVQTIKDRTGRI